MLMITTGIFKRLQSLHVSLFFSALVLILGVASGICIEDAVSVVAPMF